MNYALSDSYIPAEETGETKTITIKAKPDLIASGTYYSNEDNSQIATWFDTGYKTDGSIDGFYFEITGGWNPWGGEYNNVNELCRTVTVNAQSSTLDNNAEFDYINSSYKLSLDNSTNSLEELSDNIKKSCWLTAGTGLYIAFFGETGYLTPDIATHLKTADIVCDEPYNTDKNGDGIVTIDECYSLDDPNKKNQAYYLPYKSEYINGGVRCDLASFKHMTGADPNKIRVIDCIEEINGKNVNRAVFTFSAPYLYKSTNKVRVPKNEVIKLTIYDSYYSDNAGGYNIKFYRGASTEQQEGIFEKIMKIIEEMFSISANMSDKIIGNAKIILSTVNVNNYNNINFSIINKANASVIQNIKELSNEETTYQNKVNLIKTFYNYIVRDSAFTNAIRLFIALYISLFGLNFAMGGSQYSVKDSMQFLLKLTFVLVFTMPSGWDFYNKYIVTFFLYALIYITTAIINVINKISDPFAYIYIPEGTSLSSIFVNMDSTIFYLFSEVLADRLEALVFGRWWGFFIAFCVFFTIINTVLKLTSAAFPIMISYMELLLALLLGPIFISFYLFKTTESIFMNWLSFLGSRCANIFFTVVILLIFIEIIKSQYIEIFSYSIYKTSAWDLGFFKACLIILGFMSLGAIPLFLKKIEWLVYIPDSTNFTTGFIEMLGQVFGINVILQLFGAITKHLPSVVDSLIEIKGGKGGKMKDMLGESGNLLQETDKYIGASFGSKPGTPYLSKLESYTTPTGLILQGGKFVGKKAIEKYKDSKKNKEDKETIEKYSIKNKLYAASIKSDNKFKDLLKDKDKVDAVVDSIYNNEKNVKFSDNEEENRKFHELRKYYILMKNEENFGKYIHNDKVDIRAFIKNHPSLSQEDRELLIDSVTTKINANADFDYYKRTQELSDKLASFDPEKATDEEAEKLRKELEELQHFRDDLEELIALRSGQGNNSIEFLMSGIDLDRFGLSGAQNFTAIAGINASSFLGFNNGAANIASGMGIQLVQKTDDAIDDEDDDKKKILSMKNTNTFQMNNSLVSYLTTKINEKRNERLKMDNTTFVSDEQKEKIKEKENEISKLVEQRYKAQKRVYEATTNSALLDALENVNQKAKNEDNSQYRQTDLEETKKLIMIELKARQHANELNEEEKARFDEIFKDEKDDYQKEIEGEVSSIKRVGKSSTTIKKERDESFKKEGEDLMTNYQKQLQEYSDMLQKDMKNIDSKISDKEEKIKNKDTRIEQLKVQEQTSGKIKKAIDHTAIKYNSYKKSKEEEQMKELKSSKNALQRHIDMEQRLSQQKKQEIENVAENRKKLLEIQKEQKISELKRDEYIKMLKLNEQAMAKNKQKLASFYLDSENKQKLEQASQTSKEKIEKLRKLIIEENEKLSQYSKEYNKQKKVLDNQIARINISKQKLVKENQDKLEQIKLQKQKLSKKIEKLNKKKNTEKQKLAQEELDNLNKYEKYYQIQNELEEKRINYLEKQEKIQNKHFNSEMQSVINKTKKDLDNESSKLLQKEETLTIKTRDEIKQEKILALESINKKIEQGSSPELLLEKKRLEMDLKYIEIKEKQEQFKDIEDIKKMKYKKVQEIGNSIDSTNKKLIELNEKIKIETNKEKKKQLIQQQKLLQAGLLQYKQEQKQYYQDARTFDNNLLDFDNQQEKLDQNYISTVFRNTSDISTNYIVTTKELADAVKKENELKAEKQKLKNQIESIGLIQNAQSSALLKQNYEESAKLLKFTAQKKILELSVKQNERHTEQQQKEIEKIKKSIEGIKYDEEYLDRENVEENYRAQAIALEEQRLQYIESYYNKHIGELQSMRDKDFSRVSFESLIQDTARDVSFDKQSSQDFLNTIKNTKLENDVSLYDTLHKNYERTKNDQKDEFGKRMQKSLKQYYDQFDNEFKLQEYIRENADLLNDTTDKKGKK